MRQGYEKIDDRVILSSVKLWTKRPRRIQDINFSRAQFCLWSAIQVILCNFVAQLQKFAFRVVICVLLHQFQAFEGFH